jgi:hypothetical protein
VAAAIPLNDPSTNNAPAPETDSPPWHLIHFDVHCARCGHDLRGQADPVCPACKLEFSWTDAAPLEKLTCGKCSYHLYGLMDSRCPECGTRVNWDEALLRYRTAQKPLFEYRWRDRPIRSFFRTWFLALRPKHFWQSIDMHDTPQVRPLLLWAAMLLFLAGAAFPLMIGLMEVQRIILQSTPSIPRWSEMLSIAFDKYFYWQAWMPLGFLFWWWFVSFCALMIFRQSMRIYNVRTAHVIRICSAALTPAIPLALVFLYLYFSLLLYLESTIGLFPRNRWLFNAGPLLALLFLVHVIWSLRNGYLIYAKIPHALGVAIASQVIAGLVMLISFSLAAILGS